MPNASEKESAGGASDGIERCCSGGRYDAGYFRAGANARDYAGDGGQKLDCAAWSIGIDVTEG
jgi:hypothetical protein